MARDRRRLGPEEEALWTHVKRSVRPLRPGEAPPPLLPPVAEAQPPPPEDIAANTAPPVAAPAQPQRSMMPGLHPIGRRDRQKIVRGSVEIDDRLDLHGLTQEEARNRLAGFLARAQMRDYRIVLVITGKGGSGGFEGLHRAERGVLRRVVPLWLALPEFRRLVHGFEEAHLAHGGGGALYVRMRRRRSASA